MNGKNLKNDVELLRLAPFSETYRNVELKRFTVVS